MNQTSCTFDMNSTSLDWDHFELFIWKYFLFLFLFSISFFVKEKEAPAALSFEFWCVSSNRSMSEHVAKHEQCISVRSRPLLSHQRFPVSPISLCRWCADPSLSLFFLSLSLSLQHSQYIPRVYYNVDDDAATAAAFIRYYCMGLASVCHCSDDR